MADTAPRVYSTRFDWWVLVLFIGAGVGVGLGGVLELMGGATTDGYIMLGGLVAAVVLCRAFLFPMRYELGDEQLVVHLGSLALKYPYTSIVKAELAFTPLGGYAMSSERVQVTVDKGGGTTLISISPKDRAGFLSQLASLSPAHELVNDTLVRKA